VEGRDEGPIPYASWTGPWADDDPDGNFKAEVAAYSSLDPLATLTNLSRNLDIPLGAVVRYVLAKWASGGAEALLELGPSTVERMQAAVEEAEADGGAAARLAAYHQLRQMVGWLGAGLDDPVAAYPRGGAGAPRRVRVGIYGLARRDDRVLLVRASEHDRYPGTWSLPGGGIDHGEDLDAAVRREFREETGLDVERGELLGVSTRRDPPQPDRGIPDDVYAVQLVYAVTVPDDIEPAVTEVDGSVDAARWVALADLADLPLGQLATWTLRATDRAT